MLRPRTADRWANRTTIWARKHTMAADDDDEITTDGPDDVDAEILEEDAEALEVEPDAEELVDEEDAFPDLEDDDEVVVVEEVEEDDEDEVDDAPSTRTKRRTPAAAGEEEEDDDEDIVSPDDVEADLDRILKDRLVTAEEEEDEDEDEPDDRSEPGDRLQPKRADEQLCPNCFLLVRATAPGCPVGDDACPIFG